MFVVYVTGSLNRIWRFTWENVDFEQGVLLSCMKSNCDRYEIRGCGGQYWVLVCLPRNDAVWNSDPSGSAGIKNTLWNIPTSWTIRYFNSLASWWIPNSVSHIKWLNYGKYLNTRESNCEAGRKSICYGQFCIRNGDWNDVYYCS